MKKQYYRLDHKYDQNDLALIGQEVPHQIDSRETNDNLAKKGISLKTIINSSEDLVFYTENSNLTDYLLSTFGYQIISEKFKIVIEKYVENEIEFFEVQFEGEKKIEEKYFLMNFINVQSVMDFDKSEYLQTSDGEVIEIDKMVIDYSKIKNQIAFRLKEVNHELVVNDDLKQAIENANITGVKFKELESFKFPF